tara:strand:+ start:357 stop:935 length:579 start_codon:yes stop_codon:yes gene_type:complete
MSAVQIYKEKALDTLAALPPRDRILAVGLIVSTFFGGLGFGVYSMNKRLNSERQEIERVGKSVELIQVLQAEQAALESEVAQIEESLAKNATTDLSAFLEQSATKSGFNPKEKNMQVREKSTSKDGRLQEKVFSVSLSNLTTEEFAKFLFQTETSGYPLQIQTSTVKRRKRSDGVNLNLSLDIAAYKLVEEE